MSIIFVLFQAFKTTFDTFKDQIVTLMMAVSLLSIALKLVAARRGELVCYMQTESGILQSESDLGIANALPYIVASKGCIEEVYRLSG